MLRIGIVGMGGMGWFHTSRYLQLDDVKLTAIADIVPERLNAQNEVKMNIDAGDIAFDPSDLARYPDANQLIRHAEIDVVDICLPTDLHAEYAVQAMQAGYHVLCEKPMALNVTDADTMVKTAQQTQRKLMIAQVIRFWPEYVFLRKCIGDDVYGKIRSLNMWRLGARPAWSPDNWFLDPKRSGGAILDLHIHDVDFVNAVFGPPDHLTATGRLYAGAQSYDVIHALFTFEDGPQVHLHAGWSPAAIPFQAGYDAWFDKAFVRYAGGKLEIYDENGSVEVQLDALSRGDGYQNEIAYFLDCVRSDSEPVRCMPESTRDSMLLIEQELANMQDSQTLS